MDAKDDPDFRPRVDAAPVHLQGDPPKTLRLETWAILARRRHQDHLRAQFTDGFGQRKSEIVKIPVGIREQQDFHDWRALLN